MGAQPAPGPEGGAAGPTSGTVRPERHASTVGSVTVAWGERGEVAGSRDGASRARVGLGPSPKLEERTGGGPAGVTGPCSCFEEELGGHDPSPGARLAGPGKRWQWFGQRCRQGVGEKRTQGVRNQAESEPTGHSGFCSRDERQGGVQEGPLVWTLGWAMVCVQ